MKADRLEEGYHCPMTLMSRDTREYVSQLLCFIKPILGNRYGPGLLMMAFIT